MSHDLTILPERTPAQSEVPIAVRGNTVRDLLRNDISYATTLLIWALDTLGPECLYWHPQTLKAEVEKHAGCPITKGNFDKLMAAIAIVTTDVFFRDVSRFIQLANVLAGDDFEPDEFDPADSVECAWAITEALLLWPPDAENSEPFSDDIRHYLRFILREEGYVVAPDILRIAIDHDLRPSINADFADDPVMFSAMYENQQAKTQEVEDIIRLNLIEMMEQLKTLPLTQGSTAELMKRLTTMIRSGGK